MRFRSHALSRSLPAQETIALNDVTLPTRLEVEGQQLVLNGMALRKKSIIKLYVDGLSLPERNSTSEAILAADSFRRMVLQFLRRVTCNSCAMF